MCREPGRLSTLDKGHEEGGSAYANAGSSLRSPPGYSRASPPQKNQSLPTVLLCALTSDGTLVTATDGSARKLTISLSGWQTIGDGTYITGSSANKLITLKPADSFIGSAQSGKSAYDWITTKSATLSAGEYIKFTSAAQNTMGITVTGIYPHHGGNCITVDAVAGQSYSSINLSSDIFVDNLKSSSAYEIQTIGPATSYMTANYQGIYLTRNSTYAAMNNTASIGIDGVNFTANNNAYKLTWVDLYNGLAGNYVHASAGQTIRVATATTSLNPSDMEDGYIYIV